MGIPHKMDKWKKTVKGNKRIGVSAVEKVNTLSVDVIDSQLGNKTLTGGHAKQPRQGRRI